MNSKSFLYGVILAFSGLATATAGGPSEVFISSSEPASSTVACLVSSSNPTAGINACLCAVSGHDPVSPYCEGAGGGTFSVHPAFAAGWNAALGINSVSLAAAVPAGVPDSKILMDARADCGLTQGAIELAVSPTSRSLLSGLVGGRAAYSAVYALPVTFPTSAQNTPSSWVKPKDGNSGDPLPAVRICSYGQASAFLTGTLRSGGYGWHGDSSWHGGSRGWNANGNLTVTDLGMSVGVEWLADNDNAAADTNLGVQYVIVAGVADGLLQIGRNRFSAIGVLANSRVGYRSLNLREIFNPG